MRSIQAANILSLTVILTSITSSIFACPCQQKHPQYHYCVSDFVFQARIDEFGEVLKKSLEEPVQAKKPPPVADTTAAATTTSKLTTTSTPTASTPTVFQVHTDEFGGVLEKSLEEPVELKKQPPLTEKTTAPIQMLTKAEQLNSTITTENSSLTTQSQGDDTWNISETSTASTTEQSQQYPKLVFESRQPGQKLIHVASSSTSEMDPMFQSSFHSSLSSSVYYEYPQDYYIRYRVTVKKVYKGPDMGKAEIFTLADLNDCGMRHLRNNTLYLFTVSRGDDGRIYSTNCDWVQEYGDLTSEQLEGLRKNYGKHCKECHNSDACSNHPWFTECNFKYSSCIHHQPNRGKFGCTWEKSTNHRNCLEHQTQKNEKYISGLSQGV